MSEVKRVTAATFGSEVVSAGTPVVVDLYADWCGPCRALAPLLERLAQHYQGRVKFVKVNVDDEPDIAAHFEVSSIPTLLVFDGGRVVHRTSGMPDPRQFVTLLDQFTGPQVTAG